jgi:ribosomal protein L37AE/L43A
MSRSKRTGTSSRSETNEGAAAATATPPRCPDCDRQDPDRIARGSGIVQPAGAEAVSELTTLGWRLVKANPKSLSRVIVAVRRAAEIAEEQAAIVGWIKGLAQRASNRVEVRP